ncbi:MAG: hypothetical protein ACI9V1_002521 [Spirosomataceae bacterium]|jgi:uncharacterized protein (DUF2141 family)
MILQSICVNLAVIFYLTFSYMNFNLQISGFASDKGKAFIEILNAKGGVVSQEVITIINKKVSKEINVPTAGKYGIKVFHDENNNKKMDTNLVGFPLERWGTSNGVRPAFRAPKLDEILLEIKVNDIVKVAIR